MQQLRTYSAFLYVSLVILVAVVAGNEYRDVQPSCLDHFFHGQRKSGIYKLGLTSRQSKETSDAVFCEMPQFLDYDSVVTTTIHSGLENPQGYKLVERSTVKYHQPASYESVFGKESVMRTNGTMDLVGQDAGVLHLFPAEIEYEMDYEMDPVQPLIRAGPLVCEQTTDTGENCLFHVANHSTLKLNELQYIESISFAFRTDQPNTPLFSLKAEDDSAIQIEIAEGYLIKIKYSSQSHEEVRELKLISDGLWHTVYVNFLTSSLVIDQLETSIMLDTNRVAQPKQMDFAQFRGQITRIKYSRDEGFKCLNSVEVSTTNTGSVPVVICEKNSQNFCNCKGPAAAVGDMCDDVESLDKEQMFQMRRDPKKPALFYIDDYYQDQSLSMLFKSDDDSGLVFYTVTGTEPHLSYMQVFYVGRNMTAVVCGNRPAEKFDASCIICTIDVHEGFSTYNWNRISYFKVKGYAYLTVNEHICQLRMAPFESSHYFYAKNTRKISDHNALFVGGYPSIGNQGKTFATPLDDYIDNTREKVASIQGCIGELFVGGQRRSLVEVYNDLRKITANRDSPSNTFSIDKGCAHCEENLCNGAHCGPSYNSNTITDYVCDCASALLHNSISYTGENLCKEIDGTSSDQESISLSASQRRLFEMSIADSYYSDCDLSSGCYLNKLWVVFRPPTGNEDIETILQFSNGKHSGNRSISIGTSKKGEKVHITINGETYDFPLDILEDSRSHFIIISRNAAVGTRRHYYSTRIQVDNHHYDIPYIYINSIEKIEVAQLPESSSNPDNGGCISDIGISYKIDSDGDSRLHNLEGKTVNVIDEILHNVNARNRLRFTKKCGMRDNNIWMSPISPADFGIVGSYNPFGVKKAGEYIRDDDLAWWIILIIVLLILLAIFVLAIIICALLKQRKKRDYDRVRAERTYKKAAELKPLHSLKDTEQEKKSELTGEIPSPDTKLLMPLPHPERRDSIKRQSSNLEAGFGLSEADTTQRAQIVRRESYGQSPTAGPRRTPLADIEETHNIDV